MVSEISDREIGKCQQVAIVYQVCIKPVYLMPRQYSYLIQSMHVALVYFLTLQLKNQHRSLMNL